MINAVDSVVAVVGAVAVDVVAAGGGGKVSWKKFGDEEVSFLPGADVGEGVTYVLIEEKTSLVCIVAVMEILVTEKLTMTVSELLPMNCWHLQSRCQQSPACTAAGMGEQALGRRSVGIEYLQCQQNRSVRAVAGL